MASAHSGRVSRAEAPRAQALMRKRRSHHALLLSHRPHRGLAWEGLPGVRLSRAAVHWSHRNTCHARFPNPASGEHLHADVAARRAPPASPPVGRAVRVPRRALAGLLSAFSPDRSPFYCLKSKPRRHGLSAFPALPATAAQVPAASQTSAGRQHLPGRARERHSQSDACLS